MPGSTPTATANAYIVLNEKGRPVVRGTGSKVTMIANDHIEGGMTVAEIHEAYPHLSMAAIHAALSYYYEHQSELDAQTAELDREAEEILRQLDASGNRLTRADLERRLRDKGSQA
jgi:uncharacterized protein (DUF433 family)